VEFIRLCDLNEKELAAELMHAERSLAVPASASKTALLRQPYV